MAENEKLWLIDMHSYRDVRNCIQVILGRHPLGPHEVKHYSNLRTNEILRFFAQNPEFRVEVELPLFSGGSSNSQRFTGQPSQRLCNWVLTEVPLTKVTQAKFSSIIGWRDLLVLVWSDVEFQHNLDPTQFPAERLQRLIRSLETKDNQKLLTAKHGQTRSVCVIDDCAIVMELPTTNAVPRVARSASRPKIILRHINVKRERSRFQSVTDDPQIYLAGMPSGQYKAEFIMRYPKNSNISNGDYLQIFFDFGEGFSEKRSVKYTISAHELSLILYIELRRPVEQIRLDPTTQKIPFSIEKLNIERAHEMDLRAGGMFG